ncbi:hypothetical protein Tco_1228007, partial [Tanacetum coccineum]
MMLPRRLLPKMTLPPLYVLHLALDAIGWRGNEEHFPMTCIFDVESCQGWGKPLLLVQNIYAAGLQLLEELLLSEDKDEFGINKLYQSFALRNFDLKDMEFESANSGTTAKLPILKLENGNLWVSVPQTTQENGTSVTKMYVPLTAEEKTNKKNDNTHVVVWMNKPEVDTMSIDDLYNNFKIVEQKVKKSVGASSGAQNLAFMTAPSTSSTNDVNTASPQVSTARLSDNAVYAFMVENP